MIYSFVCVFVCSGVYSSICLFIQYLPIIYSFILVSLDNIQTQLENPYDQIGEDDITIDVEEIHDMVEE